MKKQKSLLNTDVVTQIALVVHDIDKTAQKYAHFFGVAMPKIITTDPASQTHAQYRGQPTNARAKLTFFRLKNLTLELIEPDHEPSTWREHLDAHGEGVHHIAFHIKHGDQIIAELAQNGMPLVQQGQFTGGRYSYIDSTADLKVLLELLE